MSSPQPISKGKEAKSRKPSSKTATAGAGRSRPLSVVEAASYMNVTERYIRRLVEQRRVPFLKVGRLIRLWPEDLDAYLDSCRVEVARPSPFAR